MLTLSLFTKMEQKCNMGGGGLRNRHVVKEDRISDLPEALLLHILSSLSTKEVIATSVLSKRWRSLWKLVSKLTFESKIDHMSLEDIYRSLILHKAPFLERLHLNIGDKNGRLDIGILVGIAFAHNVRELVVDLYHDDQNKVRVRFPSVLCSYNNTLEVLELMNHVLLDFPSRVCLNSLRELQLHEVVFKDEESVCNLLSGCLSLEVLVLTRLSNWNVKTYTIAVPSLKRLTIEEASNQDVSGGGYVINAPSLKYLNIKGFFFLDFCLIENAPELVEAELNDVSDITNENILASLTSAKCLSLDLPSTIKCPAGSIFYQLVSLELCINWWNLLSFMLENSPKLQNLKLIKQYSSADQESPVDWRKWNEPRCVPDCLLLHLETFVWTRYEWEGEDEKQVATYILKNATRLKKATISTKDIYGDDLEKRREMLNELASVVRSSNSCHLVFESELSLELSLSCFG